MVISFVAELEICIAEQVLNIHLNNIAKKDVGLLVSLLDIFKLVSKTQAESLEL